MPSSAEIKHGDGVTASSVARDLGVLVRARAYDLTGVLFTLLFGAPSLIYPLAPDQSLFFYVGRLWFSGGLPYRDAVDQKPPGIFALYGLATTLFGANQYAIHIAELLGIVGLGWCCARIIEPEDRPRDGVFGLCCVVLSAVFLLSFDYWCMGQVELWQGGLSLASFAVVTRGQRAQRSALIGGVLGGLATLFKPAPPLLMAALVCVYRALRAETSLRARAIAVLRSGALYGAGVLGVIGLVLGYFAANRRGISSLKQCMFDYTKSYTSEWIAAFDIDWLRIGPTVVACYVLLALGLGVAHGRRDFRGLRVGLSAVGLVLLALLTVYAQKKYLGYHWVVVVPFLSLGAAWGLLTVATSPRGALVGAVCSVAFYVGIGWWLAPPFANIYATQARYAVQLMRGELAWTDYAHRFYGPFGNDYGALDHVGTEIAARAKPGDTLCVRGYTPAIYVVAGLTCPSRLPWEQHIGVQWQPPITEFGPEDVRSKWARQHRAALEREPPTFIVTFAYWTADRDTLRAQGYREILDDNGHVLLERAR